MVEDNSAATKAVGPYLLQRTLGKGQTGLVKLGVHCVTRKTVAVKIINREKLSNSVLMKVEREIAIMKLIDHPHVLGLYDVYESNAYLYLVLEHVSGGELFDYLVKKGRLSEREARRFFRQIVSAVDFCHKHKVCHRDLKPENLLLDEHRNIKVADFGMASLQVGEKLLETSCGSPHYACPEVIRGEQYDGRRADAWSCGVILYALLVGALPFDDDNLRVLLEKVKRGTFHIPAYIPPGAHQLLRGMIEVNPKKRLTLEYVMHHSWFRGSHDDIEPIPPVQDGIQTYSMSSKADIDPDVFKSMSSLGCFRDRQALVSALLAHQPNEEKIVYYLLLSRKERQPCVEDEARAIGGGINLRDPPRKRVDSKSTPSPQLQLQRARAQSVGSANLDPLPPRSPRLSTATPTYAASSQGYYTYNAVVVPTSNRSRKLNHTQAEANLSLGGPGVGATLDHSSMHPSGSNTAPWKRKLSQTMRHLVVSPRFHRKRFNSSNPDISMNTETPSPQVAKRSWFANFRSERDKEEVVFVFRDSSFPDLKAALVQALKATPAASAQTETAVSRPTPSHVEVEEPKETPATALASSDPQFFISYSQVVNCQYEEIEENSFKVKYESSAKGKNVFKKAVKMTISVLPTQTHASQNSLVCTGASESSSSSTLAETIVFDGRTFTVTFSHISGPTRRFRRVCDKLQAAAVNPSSVNPMTQEMRHDNDSGINPSLSSDDTLTISTTSPVLGEPTSVTITMVSTVSSSTTPSVSSRDEMEGCSLLVGYESTDDCESEDSLSANHRILGDVDS